MNARFSLPATFAAIAAALALPASAGAACAAVPLKDLVTGAGVVATVQFQDGPVDANGTLKTPATATVSGYDRGNGPAQLRISTSSGALVFGAEGISPKPGETWRVYGKLSGSDELGTSVCAGSVLVSAQSASASVVVAGKTRALAAATVAGKPHSGSLASIKLPRSGNLTIRASSPAAGGSGAQAAAVLLVQPGHAPKPLKVSWTGQTTALTAKLTKLKVGKKGGTLVVVTREASFAIALRPAG